MKKLLLTITILFIAPILMFSNACTGGYFSTVDNLEFIEEVETELEEDSVQGSSYTIATQEVIDEDYGDIQEDFIVGTDIEVKEDPEQNDIYENVEKYENELESDEKESPQASEIDEDYTTVAEIETLEKGSLSDSTSHEDYNKTDNIDEKIDKELDEPSAEIEPESIKSSLGQIFKMSSEDKSIEYLFIQLLPKSGMSKVEIGKDALGMLLNSTNLIDNASDKIGKVDYVVVGVEVKRNDLWYFIASLGDLKGYLNGMLDREQLLERIQIKKGMPNVFD